MSVLLSETKRSCSPVFVCDVESRIFGRDRFRHEILDPVTWFLSWSAIIHILDGPFRFAWITMAEMLIAIPEISSRADRVCIEIHSWTIFRRLSLFLLFCFSSINETLYSCIPGITFAPIFCSHGLYRRRIRLFLCYINTRRLETVDSATHFFSGSNLKLVCVI